MFTRDKCTADFYANSRFFFLFFFFLSIIKNGTPIGDCAKHCILDVAQSRSNDNNFETRVLLLVDSI